MPRTSPRLRAWLAATAVAAIACDKSTTEPPVPTRLAFESQPTNATAGAAITPQIRVRVLDASGSTVATPATVTISLVNANGASLLGSTSAAAANGVATFSDLRIEKAGVGYVLNAASGSLTAATSNPFDVTHAAPSKLRFVGQPGEATAGKPLSPAVAVEITDAYDNRATSATTPVAIARGGQGLGAVVGTITAAAVSGLATFDKIAVTRPGTYTLTASAPQLAPATSEQFVVQPALTARFCPADVASGASFQSFPDAVAASATGGTIVICDGAHAVNAAVIDRALTIAAEHDGMATIRNTTNPYPFFVSAVPSGTVRIRGLKFDVSGVAAVIVTGTYDQVIVENSTFRAVGGESVVIAGRPTGPAAEPLVIARNNTATGFRDAFVAQTGARMNVIDNRIDSSTSNAINYSTGTSGIIQRNRIIACGVNACIWAVPGAGGPVEILDNNIENDIARNTIRAIRTQGNANIRRNRVVGTGGTGVVFPLTVASFAIRAGAIAIVGSPGATPIVEGNEIVNALYGIELLGTSSGSIHRDNRIKQVGWGFATFTSATNADVFERNDVSEFGGAINAPPTGAGLFKCNWWGGQIGPIGGNVILIPLPASAWQPFSRVPIAGKPDVACNPAGGWSPARFCPPAAPSRDGWTNFRDAMQAAGSDGTVLVCDGTFTLFTTVVDRPITIAAERPHGATFALVAGQRGEIFHVNGAAGKTTFRDLSFDLDEGRGLRIGTGVGSPTPGRYDQVLIENNRFTARTAPGGGLTIQATDIGTAKVVIRGNTFTGGLSGVSTESAAAVEVIGNTFKDQPVFGFSRYGSINFAGGGPYVARNNTITGCPHACIHVDGALSVEITDNTLETPVGAGTKAGIDVIANAANISRNIIKGPPTVENRQLQESYAFQWAGILTQLPGTTATVTGNTVLNARYGIYSNNAPTSGSDNTLTLTIVPVVGGAGVRLHRNDFIDYMTAVFQGLTAGSITCNYWGVETGPTVAPEFTDVVTPFSRVPIAGRPAVTCP